MRGSRNGPSQRQRKYDKHFFVLYTKNRLGPARLTMAVPRRRVVRAVDRNRIKRVIRESFRQHRAQLSGMDILIVARNNLHQERTNRSLFLSLERLWTFLARYKLS